MAGQSKIRSGMTLEDFLRWPRIDRQPYLEYYGDRIEAKVSPQLKHSVLTGFFIKVLDRHCQPARLGGAFPELRCTFGGRSIVPDVVFLREARIPVDVNGEYLDEHIGFPDIQIEIRSPGQSLKKTREKLEHAVANGCPLGWFVDPDRKTIDVYRRGLPPERLPADGSLDGAPVLPGFRIPVAEVYGWLIHRGLGANDPEVHPA